jgi:hypothetical protein
MSTLMRVEFSRGLRPDSARFVLMIEIPQELLDKRWQSKQKTPGSKS